MHIEGERWTDYNARRGEARQRGGPLSKKAKQNIEILPHAFDRFRERVLRSRGKQKSKSEVRQLIKNMYQEGVMFGGAYGSQFMVIASNPTQKNTNLSNKEKEEYVLVCDRKKKGVVVKTVLTKDYACANLSHMTKNKLVFN